MCASIRRKRIGLGLKNKVKREGESPMLRNTTRARWRHQEEEEGREGGGRRQNKKYSE